MTIINGNYRKFTLDNGLVVALQETPTKTVAGRLRVWHGSLNEKQGEEGIAHFLEHCLIMGGSKNHSHKIVNEIMGTFGYFNAFTLLDRTFFPVDMLAEDTKLFIQYISDAVFNPAFESSKVEEERQRVLRELSDSKSHIMFKENKDYREALCGKDSPHIYFGLGNENIINSASIKDLDNFHKRGYHPNNMDLILVGALPKNIEELIRENFGSFKKGISEKIELPKNSQLYKSTILHTSAPDLLNHDNPEQSSARLEISFVAPTETEEDSEAVSMLVYILGGDSNSKLFTSVSQKKGLAYAIDAIYDKSNNKGLIDINSKIQSTKADEAIDAIFEEMTQLKIELVSKENVERLKRKSMYNIAKTFETNYDHINAIELMIDKGITPEQRLRKMEVVTPEDIREAAIKYLPSNRTEGKYVLRLRDPLKK